MMSIEELKKQYAEDCRHFDKSWMYWQYCETDFKGAWIDCCVEHPPFARNVDYRRKLGAPVWAAEQWTPEGKRLKRMILDDFVIYKYINSLCIHGAWSIKDQYNWNLTVFTEDDFEEIPKPYSHIKKGDPVAVKRGLNDTWYIRIFSHADMSGAWVYDEGLFKGGTSNWNECLTIKEYNKLHCE